MTTYTDHNDARGRENRLAVQAWNATRARMLAAFEEYDAGCVTLYMSKADLRAALFRAQCMHGIFTLRAIERRQVQNIPREPRNEREAAKLLRAQA